jgi:hypothetical protein
MHVIAQLGALFTLMRGYQLGKAFEKLWDSIKAASLTGHANYVSIFDVHFSVLP